MTCITTRLRDALKGSAFFRMAVVITTTDCTEAADEIDRLRAELAGYVEANRHMKGELDDALEDARKYCEARREIASLREALDRLLCATEGHDVCPYAKAESRYALAPVGAK